MVLSRSPARDLACWWGILFVVRLVRSTAFGTDTDDPQQMLGNLETVTRSHGVLQSFQFSGVELNDLSAFGTDHVIVMLVLIVVLVMRPAIAKAHFTCEASLGKELERTIDRGLPDTWIFLLDQSVKIFVGQVFFCTQENIQNEVTLCRAFQPLLLNVP